MGYLPVINNINNNELIIPVKPEEKEKKKKKKTMREIFIIKSKSK